MKRLSVVALVTEAVPQDQGSFLAAPQERTRKIKVSGRDAWALQQLLKAGEAGVTPLDCPGPRWSGYIHKLRHKYRLNIETVHENHGGAFAGNHARYVLRSRITVIAIDGEQGRAA